MRHVIPYEGTEPYLFISYAHADADAVMEIAERLQREGFHIWYDAGIVVGSEWPEYIASHLAGASAMLAFVSGAYDRSENCRKEMHFALTKKIPTVNIFLERTELSPGLEMQIGSLFALMKYDMPEERFYQKLLAAPQLARPSASGTPIPSAPAPRPERRRRKGLRIALLCVGLALLAAAVTLGIVGWSTGVIQRFVIRRSQTEPVTLSGDTQAFFHEAAFERAARDYCGKADGVITVSELTDLTELTLEGEITDLSDLRYFSDCRALTVRSGALDSLKTLPPCELESLTLLDCPLTSLDGIGSLSVLRELRTDGCPIRRLGNLSYCLELRTLALEGSDVSAFGALRPLIRLCEVSLSNCGLNELRPLLGLSSLTDVTFTSCDLRGRFFRAFDRERGIVTLTLVDCELNATNNLEDFTGMTALTLIRSGARLDWSALAELPALRSVTADESMEEALAPVLAGGGTELTILKNESKGDAAA
ncbi:MAG: TIR domain-containing protein [Eubacteriales bacterium]|nr:TIR domain-containing protein [Eubacteriales bacterium]